MTSEPKRELKRYDTASLDRIYFSAALALGFVMIVAFDFWHFPKMTAVGACWVCMIAYYLGTRFLPAFFVRADQVADNIYYLGLLYTLSSLGVALFRFSAQAYAVDSIINNFGVAIFTTIAGIAGRVLIGQMRADPIDVERETRAALIETSRRLRTELDQSVTEFKNFRMSSNQILDESIEAAGKSLIETLRVAVEKFETSTTGISNNFQEAHLAFLEQAKTLNASTRRAGSAVERLIAKVESVRADEDMITKSLAPALAGFEQAASGYANRIAAHGDAVVASVKGLDDVRETAGAIKASSEALAGIVERAGASMEKAVASSSDFGSLVDSLRMGQARIAALAEACAAATNSVQAAATAHMGAIDEASKTAMARLSDEGAAVRTSVSSDIAQGAQTIADLTAKAKAFAAALDESERSISKVRQDLASMSRYIIDRLDNDR